jgi:steroid delta-isomerase-like uncharacterized protein
VAVSAEDGNVPDTLGERNAALVRRFVETFINGHDEATLEALVAPTYAYHVPNIAADQPRGPEAWRRRGSLLRTAFPDSRMIIEELLPAGDDRVVVRYRAEGTHAGPFVGPPPTGNRVTYTGIVVWRLRHGQLVEEWTEWDALGLLRQAGAAPAPPPPRP